MSGRVADYEVNGLAGAAAHTVPGGRRLILLAREVQASRKLIADLRALATPPLSHRISDIPAVGAVEAAVIRLIEEAGI